MTSNAEKLKAANPDYPVHPAAELFPAPTPEQRDALKKDIKENGIREAIVLTQDGRLLDGRTRLAIANELGIKAPTRVCKETDLAAYSVSLNLHRRHLTTQERAEIAASLVTTKHGGSKKKGSQAKQVTVKQAAKAMKVSPMGVKRAIRKKKEERGEVPPLPERPKARAVRPVPATDTVVSLALPKAEKVIECLVENDGNPLTARVIGKFYLTELAPLIPWVTPKDGGVFEVDTQLRRLCETWASLDKATKKAVMQAAKPTKKAAKEERAADADPHSGRGSVVTEGEADSTPF